MLRQTLWEVRTSAGTWQVWARSPAGALRAVRRSAGSPTPWIESVRRLDKDPKEANAPQ